MVQISKEDKKIEADPINNLSENCLDEDNRDRRKRNKFIISSVIFIIEMMLTSTLAFLGVF